MLLIVLLVAEAIYHSLSSFKLFKLTRPLRPYAFDFMNCNDQSKIHMEHWNSDYEFSVYRISCINYFQLVIHNNPLIDWVSQQRPHEQIWVSAIVQSDPKKWSQCRIPVKGQNLLQICSPLKIYDELSKQWLTKN